MSEQEKKKYKKENIPLKDGDFKRNRTFNLGIAKILDVNCSLVFCHIDHWVEVNQINKVNFKDGRYWTYQKIEDMTNYIQCLNSKQIKYALSKLESSGLIISENIHWNGNTWDRTQSYTVIEGLDYIEEKIKNGQIKLKIDIENFSIENENFDHEKEQNLSIESKNFDHEIEQILTVNIKDSKEYSNKDIKKDSKDLSSFEMLKEYYSYLKEKGFNLSEKKIDYSYVNDYKNDTEYSNLQKAKNICKYNLMLADSKEYLDKLLFIEEKAKINPSIKQDLIYGNLPKEYNFGSILKSMKSIDNVYGKCQANVLNTNSKEKLGSQLIQNKMIEKSNSIKDKSYYGKNTDSNNDIFSGE